MMISSRKIWQYKIPKIKIILKSIAGLVLIYWVLQGLFNIRYLSYFNLSGVRFKGKSHFTKEELLKISEIKTEKNIFDVDLDKIYRNFADNQWFSNVSVSRKLPGTIVVMFKEREASFVLVKKNKYYLVSNDGVVLCRIRGLPESNYLLLSGMDVYEPGTELFAEHPSLRTVIYNLAHKNLIDNIQEIRNNNGWILFIKNPGYMVFLGKVNVRKQLERFLSIKGIIEEKNFPFKSVNFRFGKMAVISSSNKLIS